MKRSEAIQLMLDTTRIYRNDLNENSSQSDMYDKILKSLEAAGMKPPAAFIITNPDNPNFPELAYFKELVNEWESEDET